MDWINVAFAICAPLAWGGLLYHRVKTKSGIGGRVIQFGLAATVTPALVILAREGSIDGDTIGTLFGAILGFMAGVYKKSAGTNALI